MNIIQAAYEAFCRTRFPLPSESQVADLERRLGVPLPPDYREFLLHYNGGYFTEPDIIPPEEGCPEIALSFLGGINATNPSAELCSPGGLTPAIFDDNDPPQMLPIGYTPMGNLLFMTVEPGADDCGYIGVNVIYPPIDKAFPLAAGIEEFFGLLREHRED
jgi:hypothetical protein